LRVEGKDTKTLGIFTVKGKEKEDRRAGKGRRRGGLLGLEGKGSFQHLLERGKSTGGELNRGRGKRRMVHRKTVT